MKYHPFEVLWMPSTPYKMWYEKEDFLKPLPLANPKMLAEPFNSPRQILPEIFWQTGTYRCLQSWLDFQQ